MPDDSLPCGLVTCRDGQEDILYIHLYNVLVVVVLVSEDVMSSLSRVNDQINQSSSSSSSRQVGEEEHTGALFCLFFFF